MIQNITMIGTGLIGTSIALALRRAGFEGHITGWDKDPHEAQAALALGALDAIAKDPEISCQASDLIILATPVLAILDWTERLAPHLEPHQLVTDVGSTKRTLAERAAPLYNAPYKPRFLPGHPMAGKESGGAAQAEATLFAGATWLFTPIAADTSMEAEWRQWVQRFGARTLDLDPTRHDTLCAWVSHLPQFVSTAIAALLEDELQEEASQHSPEAAEQFLAIGGRALREMTRLGASPYSMWRDVAHTNTEPVAATLLALEQRLTHLRENLRTPALREEFAQANAFRHRQAKPPQET